MIPPFARYPLPGLCHPERPWWVAEMGPVFYTLQRAYPDAPMLDEVPTRNGRWRRTDGHVVESDRGYNALPAPDDGIERMREIDLTEPLAKPPVRCNQVWRLPGGDEVVILRFVELTGTAYFIRDMRVCAAGVAAFNNTLLLDGSFAPWAPVDWIQKNLPSEGPVWPGAAEESS